VPIGGALMMFHTLIIMIGRLRGKEPAAIPLMQDV
jgi:hypothetical protein